MCHDPNPYVWCIGMDSIGAMRSLFGVAGSCVVKETISRRIKNGPGERKIQENFLLPGPAFSMPIAT